MTMKNNAKFEEELTAKLKIDMRNLTNFDRVLENLKNVHFNGFLLNKVYHVWPKESIGELCLMALNTDAKFDGKLTCAFKNGMRNLANFDQSTFESLKIGLWWDLFIQSRKCTSLKFTGEFCVMKMKNDTKFEGELTCQFKIDMGNLTNVDLSTQKSQKLAL